MSSSVVSEGLGEELIFLISQPRSGSTLLQYILGSHEDIFTLPEPWHMLHLVYANKPEGVTAEYNAKYAHMALQNFLKRINGGQNIHAEATRDFALRIYRSALLGTGKSLFLDKTPRYYFIIEDLYFLFPRAKFIFLLRNPISVFASILHDSFRGDWWDLIKSEERRKDLLLAPNNIVHGIKRLGETAITVRYEQLVLNPETVLEKICNHLGVKYDAQALEYGSIIEFKENIFGDSKSVHRHSTAVKKYVDSWKGILDSKAKIALAQAYINLLDDEVLRVYGEDRDDLVLKLSRHQIRIKSGKTVNQQKMFKRLLQNGGKFSSWWERLRFTLMAHKR